MRCSCDDCKLCELRSKLAAALEKSQQLEQQLAKFYSGEIDHDLANMVGELRKQLAEARQEGDELLNDASKWRNDCLHANAQLAKARAQGMREAAEIARKHTFTQPETGFEQGVRAGCNAIAAAIERAAK